LVAEQQGILLVANGVTTVMNMGDYERHDLIALSGGGGCELRL